MSLLLNVTVAVLLMSSYISRLMSHLFAVTSSWRIYKTLKVVSLCLF